MKLDTLRRRSILLAALLVPALAGIAAAGALEKYVAAPDPSFAWKVEKTVDLPGQGSVSVVGLTSQTWQGIPWRHWVHVIRPEKVGRPEIGLLIISGGSVRAAPPSKLPGEVVLLAPIASQTGTIIAVLGQVPNQPLFGNLREDGLISHTFAKFMETGDETWPCLLPMTKSAVRALDAVQALAKEKWSQELKRFVVTGASKRGWTTWLTGAVDPRVAAIAPMVIDTLNLTEQMPLQVRSFGGYSEQIKDYTERGLTEVLTSPAGKRLVDMVDPWAYREKLSLPKLVVLGTNDRYWPVDAVKLYFPGLPGEKSIHYEPNAGHSLGLGAVAAISAFYSQVTAGEARPKFRWEFSREGTSAKLVVTAEDAPVKAELWTASAPTRDFRPAAWSAAPLAPAANGRFEGKVEMPAKGFSALFAMLTYKSPLGQEYGLSTNIEVLGDPPAGAPASPPAAPGAAPAGPPAAGAPAAR
jgi:PhoPQ-activated pathogenicity-related protein